MSATTGRTRTADARPVPIDNEYYDEVGDDWWNTEGPLRVLHEMNPARTGYFDTILRNRFAGRTPGQIRVVDLGCGGGLVSEDLASRGYPVTGIDLSAGTVEAARRHAAATGVQVTYRVGSAYGTELPDGCAEAVVASDVLEHFQDLPAALAEIQRLLVPGGVLLFDTVNRTVRSYLLLILVAEKLLRIIKPGTHNWRMFIRPAELSGLLADRGMRLADTRGLGPARALPAVLPGLLLHRRLGRFAVGDDLSASYIGYATKPGPSER
ncbi:MULTISPECIES: bifunctional 2-polyprenyl-6-hydroxyphenol methylase/3-demethylubiquinol 3-O-methyltransferase UbiG [unclassified Streptomyces]|uniref:bifunctional 2-polyprenyl-6-hydroxyphenol methylase/3-demethylubiquinol 3-O-methyltransferase UbiG n=1 Tax=unclassified Streptomyces TaxID=2593676 RepID=UPI002257ED33|nr:MULTISPECIES: bifunctional 2-polyprenyl-6-hydroxyphenol methylase/3-demethylubiquinol 3-O-methyltransferase UbiG [unclassified Streptomyces]MCX5141905.1 bifunctional 2-polyprenyl-6-hydroxyphenol methylase/3-demethylubiquinol 3-O-methyltransferase UbiG [Streptomyces sp. NBC_00338]WRZ66379.1 bifunctional 2-polyprenyl-6-hydroxyphenol methylase/3-demethylubiquinol 3-O-methyltransferase UbiG [Streptomyces sp. NBC_01257]WSU60373.1 bifunctional 2-polyprenyl-6-hydroxyphenol methylase/3-demethylubiqui